MQTITPLQYVLSTTLSTSTPVVNDGEYGVGEFWIDTNSSDAGNGIIYIRTLMKFETINKKVTYLLHSKGGVKETTPKKQVVDSDDKIRLSKGEIEFILNLIHDGMIPGKKLMEVGVVEKLQNTYKKLM